MVALNEAIVERSEAFYSYRAPPTSSWRPATHSSFPPMSVPETLKQDAELKQKAAEGKLKPAHSSCASPRPSARLIPKTTSSTPAGIPRQAKRCRANRSER